MKTYMKKLINGEISLFITFWIWFFLASILIEFLFETSLINNLSHSENSEKYLNFIINLLILFYSIFIFVTIFKSSGNYKGSKIWMYLSRIIVSFNLLFSISVSVDDVKYYFFEDYLLSLELDEFKKQLPIRVDDNSELYDIVKQENNLNYFYKFYNITVDELKEKRFEKQIQDSLCEDETSLYLLKKDYILNYFYIDEKGNKASKVITTKESCGVQIYDLDILKQILKEGSNS